MESNGVPSLNSPRSSGFPKVPFDPWTDEMYNNPNIVIKYEVLLGNLLKYGPDNLDDATYHFITHGNPTKEQKVSIFRFIRPTLADLRKIIGAEKVPFDPDNYSATYPPFRSIYMREDERYILAGIRDLSDPFFLDKRDAVLRECRELLGDDYENGVCSRCGLLEPCFIHHEPGEEQIDEYSDDDSMFSFEEAFLKVIRLIGKGEI